VQQDATCSCSRRIRASVSFNSYGLPLSPRPSSTVVHQQRALKPFHLPGKPPRADFYSLEVLELPLLRSSTGPSATTSGYCSGCTSALPAETTQTGAAASCGLVTLQYVAPLPSVGVFTSLGSFCHTAALDLSGHVLPDGCIALLAERLPRLRSLQLDRVSMPAAALLAATGLMAMRNLSLAGVQLTGALPQQQHDSRGAHSRRGRGQAAAPLACAAASGPPMQTWDAASAGRLLDAVLRPQLTRLCLDAVPWPQVCACRVERKQKLQPCGGLAAL
jgi:hypothetical protein